MATPKADEGLAALLGALIDEGRELDAARLLYDDLAGIEQLSEDDRARIAAEVAAAMFEA